MEENTDTKREDNLSCKKRIETDLAGAKSKRLSYKERMEDA